MVTGAAVGTPATGTTAVVAAAAGAAAFNGGGAIVVDAAGTLATVTPDV